MILSISLHSYSKYYMICMINQISVSDMETDIDEARRFHLGIMQLTQVV